MTISDQYRISGDADRKFIRLSLSGVLDVQTIDVIIKDFRFEICRLEAASCETGSVLTLVDLRTMSLQSQEIAARIQMILIEHNHVWEKVAVLLPASTLHAMQIKRISPVDNHAFFKNEAEAESWLFG